MKINEFNKELIRRYRDNKATEEELETFFHLMNEGNLGKELEEVMNEDADSEDAKVVTIPFYKRKWLRAAAAAAVLVAIAAAFLFRNKTGNDQPIVNNGQPTVNDVAPGGNKAVLTLADGSTIILDNAANGTLTQQGNSKVLKLDNGQIAYTASNQKPTEVIYNTITTPRGGQYQLVLSDGTKVWLNSESSFRFPANFAGNERIVELTGEGYFEVARNASMPFKVSVAGKGEVEVLGTHFNINSYADEATINTTLLEGKVKVTALNSQQLLSPGQQAQLNSVGLIALNKNPDIEEVMAWKNGKFQFGEGADIASIMRQISRWYNVEVEYKGTVTEHIGGTISRNVNVSKVFEMLEMTGTVKFQVAGKKVIVMPHKK